MMTIAKITKIAEDKYEILSPPCPLCKNTTVENISGQQLFQYHQGAGATQVLPDVSVDVRERFMSGFCGSCWTAAFGSGEDDE